MRRLEAGQSSLFQFRTSNMKINPDNSLSPVAVKPLIDSIKTSTQQASASHTLSKNAPTSSEMLSSEPSSSAMQSIDGMEKSTKPSIPTPSSVTTWTSEGAQCVRRLLVRHLESVHTSRVDKATKNQILKRTLSKVSGASENDDDAISGRAIGCGVCTVYRSDCMVNRKIQLKHHPGLGDLI